jgi:hypothetical protein
MKKVRGMINAADLFVSLVFLSTGTVILLPELCCDFFQQCIG